MYVHPVYSLDMNNNDLKETIRQMLADWNNLTEAQQAEALAKVAA